MILTLRAQANNPYIISFESALPTSYIIYNDATNLYGWATIPPMPIGAFELMTAEEAWERDWLAQTADQPAGDFIQARSHSRVELHEAKNDEPLATERLDVQGKKLSEIQVDLRTQYKISRPAQSTMFIPNRIPNNK